MDLNSSRKHEKARDMIFDSESDSPRSNPTFFFNYQRLAYNYLTSYANCYSIDEIDASQSEEESLLNETN